MLDHKPLPATILNNSALMKTLSLTRRPSQIAAFHYSPSATFRKISVGKSLLTLFVVLLSSTVGYSQYTLNGNAFANAQCGCYTITQNAMGQGGSVWNINTINLTNSFDFTFDVYLGCGGLNSGADGIAFGLQPIGTGVGSLGGGMGLGGVSPSFGVFIDTYQNPTPDNDPWSDHLAINANGNIYHDGSATDLAGPIVIPEIEDCAWHAFRVSWNAATLTFQVYLDGILYITYTGDIVNNIFSGNPNVYFGFAGATGYAANLQQICSSVQATFAPSATTACLGDPVTFTDGSTAGGPILSYSWDLDDGNFSTSQLFTHTYTVAGTYNVDLTVTDIAGCTDTYTIPVTITAAPTVTITGTDPLCAGENTGALTAVGAGGVPTYTYDWTPGGTNPNVINATAGTYDIVITDVAGCTGTGSYTLVDPAALTASDAATPETCVGDNDGAITLTGGGGTPGYTYDIGAGPQASGSFSNLTPGNYNYTITDANGCTIIGTINVAIGPNCCPMTNTVAYTDPLCAGVCDGTITLTENLGAPAVTFSIDGGTTTQANGNFTGVCAGTYNIQLEDGNGCLYNNTVTLTDPPPVVGNLTVQTDISCFGVCDGTVTVGGSGGTGAYSYDIGTGTQASGAFAGLCVGANDVTVTDANGCSFVIPVTIIEPTVLGGTITAQTDVSCNGVCDGTATAATSGGTTPYTYDIGSGPQATGVFTGLCVGANDVTVIDANGCMFVIPVTIIEPSALGGGVNAQTNVTCNGDCDGTFTVAGSGGIAPYTYDIGSGPQASGAYTGLCAGTNDVTVTDANACTFIIPVTIIEPTALVGTLNSTADAYCGAANGEADLSASGGTGPYNYDIGTGVQTTGVFAGLLPGGYTVAITDASGCSTTVPLTILDLSGLNASITAQTDVSCFGLCDGTVGITASGSAGPYTYDIGAGPGASGTFTGLCVGANDVTVNDANGCPFIVTVTILEPTALTSTITGIDATCNLGCDGTIDLIVGGGTVGYTYAWAGPGGPYSTEDLSSLCAGAYDATVTDANGCTNTESYVIAEPTAIVLNTTNNSSNCGQADGSVGVTATGGTVAMDYTYEWSDASGTVVGTTSISTNLPAGTYTILITDDNGCAATVIETISDLGGGTVSASVISNYNGQDISCASNCDGEITIVITGGAGPYNYSVNGTTQPTAVVDGLCAGTYPITVIDNVGCIATTTITLSEPTPLVATTVITHEICAGDCLGSISLTASGGTGPYTFTFDGSITYGGAANLGNLCAGSYDVGAMDANGCQFDLTVSVDPGANIADATINAVESFCLDNAATTLTAAHPGGTWSGNGVDPSTGVFDPATAGSGIHQIFYTITGACGDADDVIITVYGLPIVDFIVDNPEGCASHTATFANITTGSASCFWDFGIGTENACGPHTITYDDPGSYDVSLTVISVDGCTASLTNLGMINVYENPIADFEFGPQPTTVLDPTIDFINTSHLGDSWQWFFDDLDSSNLQHPTYNFEQPGVYVTQLIVTTNHGCVDVIEYPVEILESTGVYVPNAFTPDGDGVNDFFFPVLKGVSDENYTFFVFNRWGELIFESYDIEQQWDGTYQSVQAKSDVYVWKLVISSQDNTVKEFLGHVSILR